MQVVVDPEQILFLLIFPLDGEILVAQELGHDLAGICHTANLLPVQLRVPMAANGQSYTLSLRDRGDLGAAPWETRRDRQPVTDIFRDREPSVGARRVSSGDGELELRDSREGGGMATLSARIRDCSHKLPTLTHNDPR